MLHLLLVAFLVAGGTADQDLDLDADASQPTVQVYNLDEIHHAHHREHHGHGKHGHREEHLPTYDVHLSNVHGHKGQSKINRIVTDLYNPDYYEPIRILDYRYLKTGGRDYTRSAGGEFLILPKNVRINHKKEFENYDELLEFLRLKQLAELEAHKLEMSKLGYDHRLSDHYHQRVEVGRQHHGHHNYQREQLYGYGGAYKRDAEASPEQPVAETKEAKAQ